MKMRRFEMRRAGATAELFSLPLFPNPLLKQVSSAGVGVWDPRFRTALAVRGRSSYLLSPRRLDGWTSASAWCRGFSRWSVVGMAALREKGG